MKAQTLLVAVLLASPALAEEPPKEALPGAKNYTRVDATVACGGATDPDRAFPELKRRGFRAVINLRTAAEPEANLEAEQAAARAAGLRYIHLPLNASAPDPTVLDRFLAAVADTEHQPVYIHCASANRVGAVWLAKRVVLDGWSVERATTEAETIGLRSEALRSFALDYVKARGGR